MQNDPTAPLPADQPSSDDHQQRIAEILDEYLCAAERGEPISPEALLERYAEDASQLRGYLSGLQLFHDAAKSPLAGPPSAPLLPKVPLGDRLGDYELHREIGRGGMGVVYEATQISLRRRVALKVLPSAGPYDDKQIRRFQNEAQAAATVDHPHIVPVYAVGESDGVHYYAMQMIDGTSLAGVLADLREGPRVSPDTATLTACSTAQQPVSTRIPTRHCDPPSGATGSQESDRLRELARLGAQAASALHAAHDYGVVHRDVKPSNLLLDRTGKLWVADFGLARTREAAGATQTGGVMGTMRYMSPEQAAGDNKCVDHRTDIYSLGVTLYELATLHHPAEHASDLQLLVDRDKISCKPPRHWNRQIPVDLQTIIMKAAADSPADRYATAEALADDLQRFLDNRPILATPPSVSTRLAKWVRRRRRVVYSAACLLLLAFVAQSYNTLLLTREGQRKDAAIAVAQENNRRTLAVLDRFGAQTVDQLKAIPGADGVRYQLLRDCLQLYEDIASQSAGIPEFSGDLARAYDKMAALSDRLGANDEALAHEQSAVTLWRERLAELPGDESITHDLARALCHLGLFEIDRGEATPAMAHFEEADALLSDLRRSGAEGATADDAAVIEELAAVRHNQGLALNQMGQHAQAERLFHQAAELYEDALTASPDSETVLRGLAHCCVNLAAASQADGAASLPQAVSAYRRAIEIQRQLVERDKVNRLYQGELARTYSNLGVLLSKNADWDNAQLCYANAVDLQNHLVASSPLAVGYRRDLAISYNNLAMARVRAGDLNRASDAFRQAAKGLRVVLASAPNDHRAVSSLGCVYNNLGLLLEKQGRLNEAVQAFDEAIALQQRACDATPQSEVYRNHLRNHQRNRDSSVLALRSTTTTAALATPARSVADPID